MKLTFKIVQTTPYAYDEFVYPEYKGLKFSLANDKGKGIFKVTSELTFLKDDYDQIKTSLNLITSNILIRCYNKGAIYFEAEKENITITDDNESFKQIKLKVVATTEYFNSEWQNIDKKYNINGATLESNDLYFDPGFYQNVRYTDDFTLETFDATDGDINGLFGVVGYDIEKIDDLYCTDPLDPAPHEYNGTVHYIRQEAVGFYIGSVKYPPEPTGWTYITDVTINGVTYPSYYKTEGSDTYTFFVTSGIISSVLNSNVLVNKPPINYTGVTRKVTTVIEYLFNEMGLTSIAFDTTGTATDSFYSFKNYEGENLTYNEETSNKMYSHLLIMNLTDFIPAEDDGQNDVPASQTNISLKTILDFFDKLNFEWFLEDRSGTYYFILQHKKDKTLASGNPNLRDYFNLNRTYLENLKEHEPAEYYKLINETTCISFDFVGTDLEFVNINGVTSRKSLTDGNIYLDLDDISNRRDDAYDVESVENVVIICGQNTTGQDYTREAEGVLTTVNKNNNELSFSYLSKNIFGQFPDAVYNANNTTYTADAYKLKKRKKMTFTIPIDNLKTDFDISKYVTIFGENAEVEKIEQSAFDNIGKLTLKI